MRVKDIITGNVARILRAQEGTSCFSSGSDPEQSLDKLRLSLRITYKNHPLG